MGGCSDRGSSGAHPAARRASGSPTKLRAPCGERGAGAWLQWQGSRQQLRCRSCFMILLRATCGEKQSRREEGSSERQGRQGGAVRVRVQERGRERALLLLNYAAPRAPRPDAGPQGQNSRRNAPGGREAPLRRRRRRVEGQKQARPPLASSSHSLRNAPTALIGDGLAGEGR